MELAILDGMPEEKKDIRWKPRKYEQAKSFG